MFFRTLAIIFEFKRIHAIHSVLLGKIIILLIYLVFNVQSFVEYSDEHSKLNTICQCYSVIIFVEDVPNISLERR